MGEKVRVFRAREKDRSRKREGKKKRAGLGWGVKANPSGIGAEPSIKGAPH